MRLLAALLLALLPAAAFAQANTPNCPQGTAPGAVGCFPAAQTPLPTDLVLGWQIEATPKHTVAFTLAQIASIVGTQPLSMGNNLLSAGNVNLSGGTISGLSGTLGNITFQSTSGGWSSSNLSEGAVLTASGVNTALGMTDASGANPWALWDSGANGMQLSAMPALTDSTTPPTPIQTWTTSAVQVNVPLTVQSGSAATISLTSTLNAGTVGKLSFMGQDSTGATVDYGDLACSVVSNTHGATSGACDMPVLATGSTAPLKLSTWLGQTVNVVAMGADPTGGADSAPAFRAAIASGRRVFVPPGTYSFQSTVAAPCCAFDNPAVLVQGQSNFEIDGYGATINVASGIALSSAFHFDQDGHFVVRGLTIVGNRTGLSSGQENAGIATSSDVDFKIEDMRFTGFGGNGAAIAGDWLVDGAFSRLQMDGVGHCYDVAYLKHVTIGITHALGADTNGNSGTGQVGQTCLSVIIDPPNASNNNTGIAYTESENVSVLGVEEGNFNTGALIQTGTGYRLIGNYWHDNPGAGGVAGLGVWIDYNSSASVGVPPSNIVVSDTFRNNGSVAAGTALLISASAIANSDTMSNIVVTGSQFDNNATTGVNTDTVATAKVPGLTIVSNGFDGAAQSIGVGTNALAAATTVQTQQGAVVFSGSIGLPNNTSLTSRNASGSSMPMIFGDPSNETVIRSLAPGADVLFQDSAGTSLMSLFTNLVHLYNPLQLANYTYATLPSTASGTGNLVFCSDCDKPGEGAGAGTGMPVFNDGHSHWVTTAGTVAAN